MDKINYINNLYTYLNVHKLICTVKSGYKDSAYRF